MPNRLILVRHPPVAKAWAGRCYGRSDMGLSREGLAMAGPLIERLAAMRPQYVIHSGLLRTRMVAEPLAESLGLASLHAPAWQERDFGDWEGQTWNAIYRATGNAMDGMLDTPDSFRPGGNGETTGELITRISSALKELPRSGCAVVVSHGGPIAIVGHLRARTSITALATFITPQGSLTDFQNETD